MERTDCFANRGKNCYCLKEKYCEKEQCSFYKNRSEVSLSEIESAVRKYSIKGNTNF